MSDQPRTFDHSPFKSWPEWQAVAGAIAELAQRLDRESWGGGRRGWVEMCADLARTAYAGDTCSRCDSSQAVQPFKVDWVGSGIDARYRCTGCSFEWGSFYAYPPLRI